MQQLQSSTSISLKQEKYANDDKICDKMNFLIIRRFFTRGYKESPHFILNGEINILKVTQ